MMYRKYFFSTIFILSNFLFFSQTTVAQVQSLDNIKLLRNTSMTITGELQFSKNGGDIITAKEGCNSHIGFVEGSNWSNASDDQFIDGMVKVMHDKPFTFPIGAEGEYHPVTISGGVNTMAAYIAKDPSKIQNQHNDNSLVDNMKANGYWIVQGDNSTGISLSWKAADNIAVLTDNVKDLSIIGFKNGSWTVIPSVLEKEQSLTEGTISTSSDLVPNDFDYFTLGTVKSATVRSQSLLSVYPNPVMLDESITVEYDLDSKSGLIQVISTSGVLLFESAIANSKGTLNSFDMPTNPGTYFVRIIGDNGVIKEKKVVVLGF